MIRFRLYFDKDAETAWLDQMAQDGWAMKRFFAGFYSFEACEKGEYVYQVDFGDRMFAVSSDYRELMQDMGIEIVQTWGYWVILRKRAAQGKFELYTDAASRVEHYRKIRRMFRVVTVLELLCMFGEFYLGAAGGIVWAYVFAFLFAALAAGLTNAVFRLNAMISEMEAHASGIEKTCRRRNVSALLVSGLLLNSCALILTETAPYAVSRTVQVAAIVLMAAGLFQTCRIVQ
ncbi:MAG: DUF2812 domain-containing protein [Lachnospiraceae bacterium]|nr:DUF2812 domain-containing protein [Lachnospiraceae bacterium]